MIRYALACEAGHAFESWFRDAAGFDAQAARGLVTCPACGSARVGKALMTPALAKGALAKGARAGPQEPPRAAPEEDAAPAPALLGEAERARREAVRALRARVLAGAEDVGRSFPAQALAMHRGEEPHRPIRGEATGEEARDLVEEGVAFAPLPPSPDAKD